MLIMNGATMHVRSLRLGTNECLGSQPGTSAAPETDHDIVLALMTHYITRADPWKERRYGRLRAL